MSTTLETEIVQEFVAESSDLLDSVEPTLIGLQHACDQTGEVNPESINTVFRLFHSMKGGAGMLELNNVARLTHAAENLLTLFRDETKGIRLSRSHTDVLFVAMDLIRKMLDQISQQGNDSGFEGEVSTVSAQLAAAAEGKQIHPQCVDTVCVQQPIESSRIENQAIRGAAELKNDSIELVEEKQTLAENLEMDLPPEMVNMFVNEAEELLDKFEAALIALEKGSDPEAASEGYRAIHSFKGNCGFMGFADLEELSHRMESVLDGIRDKTIEPSPDAIAILLNWIDLLRRSICNIAQGGNGSILHCDIYIEFLEEMIKNWSDKEDWFSKPTINSQTKKGEPQGQLLQNANLKKSLPNTRASLVRQDIRVDLSKLDALINLVGELVIAEAMVTRHPTINDLEDESVERAVHQLRRVSRELQDVAMSVRMIPLAATFQKMIRLVHDLSHKSGKKVDLQLLGEDTEVDKTVIELISDPLVHIVRNALDHGLEPPGERAECGKVETGTLRIEGKHQGGEVWITIRDDGRGLDRDKIYDKAVEKGLISVASKDLSDSQIYNLIFEPGFSTADKVTDISGRGVGMDVVRRNLEKLKGRIDINSSPGEGSTFTLRIPLTLAIIDGMLVRVGESCFTIPILSIKESINPELEQITTTPDGTEIVQVRDELFPIVRLHSLFKKNPEYSQLNDGILVLVEAEGQTVALFVDELLGQQETVIKGLSHYIADARGVSGCTILGDGQVSLILDISGLIAMTSSQISEGQMLLQ